MSARRRAVLVTVLAVVTANGNASAESGEAEPPARLLTDHSEDPVVLARAAFNEGVESARARRFEQARTAFQRSLSLVPHAATLWNLALSELELGRWSVARAHLQQALERVTRDPTELGAAMRAAVEQRLTELDQRLVRLSLRVIGESVRVAIDGFAPSVTHTEGLTELTLIEPRTRGTSPTNTRYFDVLLEPGPHELVVETEALRSVLQVHEPAGTRRTLELAPQPVATTRPPLATPAPMPSPAPHPLARPRAPAPLAPPRHPRSASPLQLPAFGVAAAGATASAVFGLLALDAARDLDRRCPSRSTCPAGSKSRRDALARFAVLSDASLAVAVIAAGVGFYVTLVPPNPATQSGGGIVLRGMF